MTRDEAQSRVEQMRVMANSDDRDDERLHRYEDALRDDFIEFVATRDDELGEIAKIILSTNDIYFSRWYA